MDREKLKKTLVEIKNKSYEVPENVIPFNLTLDMLDYIGDIDSVLRDDLILTTLYMWILKDVLTVDETYKVVKICLDEKHLFYKIGQVNDSVFTRTFSALVIAFALYKHRDRSYISRKDINFIFKKVLQFAQNDIDVRGYVKEKGWAHGVAHLADVFKELAYCEELGYEELKLILETVRKKIHINNYTYIHEEDERLVTAVVRIFERKIIDNIEVIEWIKHFSAVKKTNEFSVDVVIELNVKNFLRSLYFRLYEKPEYKELVVTTREVLKDMCRFK